MAELTSAETGAGITLTPWGPSESLRGRMLPPGPGTPPEEVAKNQRERLFGAMVASVAERGYAGTRINDLVAISGVSRRSFYDLFPDMKACFVATLESLLAVGAQVVVSPTGSWDEQVRNGAAGFAKLVAAQPAAAQMCLVEAFAAGPEGTKPLELAIEAFEAHAKRAAAESPEQAGMPAEMITADVGAILEITRHLLNAGRVAELPDLMEGYADVVLSHRPPPEPLRLATRPPTPAPETIDAHDHGERALRAFAVVAAERGYANTTVDLVVKRASMSPTTFYANFRDKEDAMMAAIDSAGAQVVASILPAFRRNPDWLHGVRAAHGAFFNFLASRPSLAQLLLVEVYAAGPKALRRREEALRPLDALLDEGRARAPRVTQAAIETIAGGIYALAYKTVRDTGPEGLPGLAPVCTYMTLAPFVGVDEACGAANGDGRGRSSSQSGDSIRAIAEGALGHRVLGLLTKGTYSLGELADELGEGVEQIVPELEGLEIGGLIESIARVRQDGEVETVFNAPHMDVIELPAWARLSLAERQQISAQIGHLIQGDVQAALKAGTFDSRLDRYLVRVPFVLDERGWDELSGIFDEFTNRILAVQAESKSRVEESEDQGILARAILTLFEVPPKP